MEPPLEQSNITEKCDIERRRHTAAVAPIRRFEAAMKNALSGRNYISNLEIMPIMEMCSHASFVQSLLTTSRSQKNLELTAQKCNFLANYRLSPAAPHRRSRPYMERIRQGEGGWSRPSKTALEQSHLTEKFEVRESHTETETKKNPGQSLSSQEHESFYV